ncbi:MAG TPA: hypothetical protein VIT85_02080 [Solirubrobacterales bacterium]
MKRHLTYGNVMSTLAVLLVLGGATAVAANQLAKNSVGTKQLKKNAVTTAKIKKNAVTRAKIKNKAVNGAKVADGSLTGADIDAASTPFTRIVARLRSPAGGAVGLGQPLQVGNYTQNAGEDNEYLGAVDIHFSASCAPPRQAVVALAFDQTNPNLAESQAFIAQTAAVDLTGGDLIRRVDFSQVSNLAFPTASPMSRLGTAGAVQHSFTAVLGTANCSSGSGVTAENASVDVIGSK